ncbi:PRC-barrel domain-containing protein [Neoaquamicrobium sediminum]|uniref:PRC-barrel domain-containing protein n=2 Tax=Neoaquamicrobium sediminum TaxID=1849104 RepID=UPI00403646FD
MGDRLIFFESEPDRRWPRCRVVKVTSGPPLRKFGSGRDRAKEHAQGEFNMIRNLLATTAIATLIATGAAVAQTTAPSADAPMEAAPQPQVKHAEGHLASNLIGETVYNGSGEGAENIGEVKDLVLDSEGNIQAIVVGVGGFLGIGEKQVALQYDLVEWTEMDGEEYIVVETTREALEAQQEFDLAAYEMQPADAEVGNTQPATAEDLAAAPVADDEAGMTDDMAAAPANDATAPADDMAAAPANEETAAPADNMAATEEAAPADDMAASEEAAPAGEETAAAPADDTMTETDETQTSAIDRSSLNEVQVGDISADDFVGTTVYGANDENIGEIGDIILSDDGQVEAVIIDVGGFLGIGEKEVAVSMDNLAFLTDADGEYYLYTTFTQEQLEAQAAYDEGSFAENRDEQLLTVQ